MNVRSRVTGVADRTGMARVRRLRRRVAVLEDALPEHTLLQGLLDDQVARLEDRVDAVVRARATAKGDLDR